LLAIGAPIAPVPRNATRVVSATTRTVPFGAVTRSRRARSARPQPPKEPPLQPLPHSERTVGQLVAESIRLYGSRFWPSLALGVPVVAANFLAVQLSGWSGVFVLVPVGSVLLSLTFVAASVIAHGRPERRTTLGAAFAAGILVFLPFPLLVSVYILPGLAWLAFVGLAVPAAVVEEVSVGGAFRRAIELARADYVHALGSFATLAILLFVTQTALSAALRAQGEQAAEVAGLLAGLVVSPLLFLGGALLYLDQAARVGSRSRRARRSTPDADLPDADHAHREGRPDPQVESRPPA
jgi:hypothetical protein